MTVENSPNVDLAWAALGDVSDPCSVAVGCAISLVDMQIVQSIVATDDGVRVTLQLTEPSCIFAFHICEEVETRLHDALGADADVEVRLAHDYPTVWTEDSIAPAARKRLQEVRERRRLIPLHPIKPEPPRSTTRSPQ